MARAVRQEPGCRGASVERALCRTGALCRKPAWLAGCSHGGARGRGYAPRRAYSFLSRSFRTAPPISKVSRAYIASSWAVRCAPVFSRAAPIFGGFRCLDGQQLGCWLGTEREVQTGPHEGDTSHAEGAEVLDEHGHQAVQGDADQRKQGVSRHGIWRGGG